MSSSLLSELSAVLVLTLRSCDGSVSSAPPAPGAGVFPSAGPSVNGCGRTTLERCSLGEVSGLELGLIVYATASIP